MAARITFADTPAGQAFREQYGRFKQGLPQFPTTITPAPDTASSVGSLPDYLGGGVGNVMQPQPAPGQMEAIASQLSMGYPGMDHLGWLKSIYEQQAPMAPAPAPVSAAPAPAPVATGGSPVAAPVASAGISPTQLQNIFGSSWGQRTGTSMSRGNR